MVSDGLLESVYPTGFPLGVLLVVLVLAVHCVEFLLQPDDGLVAFIEAGCQSDHDVPLLEQQLLVAVDLCLVLLNLLPLSLQLTQPPLVLLPYQPLPLLQGRLELRRVLDLLTTHQQLRVEHLDLLFEPLLLLLLDDHFARPDLELLDDHGLVFLSPLPLLLEPHHRLAIHYLSVSLLQLIPQLLQLHLILPEEGPVVKVFVDSRLVLDFFGAGCELEGREGLVEGVVGR